MSDYPSDVGHWERINDSAGPLFERPLNLPLIVQDLCRALLDLHRVTREAKADAWDEGFDAGHETARFVQPGYPDTPPNPYRHEGVTP